MRSENLVVSGKALIGAYGIGIETSWKSMLAKEPKPIIREYVCGDGTTYRYPVYPHPEINLRDWVDRDTYEWLSMQSLDQDADFSLALVAIQQALEDAGLLECRSSRISLVLGHENLGVAKLADLMLRGQQEGNVTFNKYSDSFFQIQTFPYLFYLSKIFNLTAPNFVINNACATGLYGLLMAQYLLDSDSADAVVIACSDYAHITKYLWLQEKGFISRSGIVRPFDRDRDGSVLGDGAAAIVLEKAATLSRRRHLTNAISYKGGIARQESWRMTFPNPVDAVHTKVLSDTLAQWALEGLDLLVPHGAGSTLWDRYEAESIRNAFSLNYLSIPTVMALKGYLGHTLGASGLIETVLMLECMNRDQILPTLQYDNPDRQTELPLSQEIQTKPIRRAIKSLPAYGGFHATAMFEKTD
ncbi:beta-ketoacyl synthase N-terminal-like domain-containing protein [Paenibacillus kobensis]|uniref:beta-ketoacyl synthase N-terminal-like domain-containing protein n=1 Tax=Paenibacillus kobensis TaxID=59841 RepID=UPI000FDA07A2|nr:beta-ketoacyl synthase N-terminal-like domain-containing protein [Paenibacillus kobensis]